MGVQVIAMKSDTFQKLPDTLSTDLIEHDIRNVFQLPICTANGVCTLDEDIVCDLELVQTVDIKETPVLSRMFGDKSLTPPSEESNDLHSSPQKSLGNVIQHDMAKYYTSNPDFIKETQQLLKKWKGVDTRNNPIGISALTLWNELRNDKGFKEKYIYLDWDSLLFLNTNQSVLQALSIYNLISPVLALLVPCIICIVPFFMMISRGNDISFTSYVDILKSIAGNHAIVKVFTGFSGMNTQQTLYALASMGFYLLSLYQNTQICMKFYANIFKIHDKLFQISEFIKYVELEMDAFLKHSESLHNYETFNTTIHNHKTVLVKIREAIENIPPCKVSYAKLMDMGKVLKWFYLMHTDEEFHDTMLFSFGFIGYIDNMQGVQECLNTFKMNYGSLLEEKREKSSADIVNKKKKSTKVDSMLDITGVYHPSTDTTLENPVKNDITLKKDCIITGPNASGKTTMLKSLFLSILLTQQYGCGFYETCSLVPYTHLHCYLNIPDTSGRDSLFQSESRKCKDILDSIRQGGTSSRHFCLFDELYSGTNPNEAVKCGFAYLSHLSETENIHYVLTTHYTELCEKLHASNGVATYRMKVNSHNHKPNLDHDPEDDSEDDTEEKSLTDDVEKHSEILGSFEYLYEIEEGINEIDGGIEVLRQMQYPIEIIDKLNT